MLSSNGCITAPYGGATSHPLACVNLDLPHFGDGNHGWPLNIGWVVDHPIISSLILAVLLTIAKALVESRKQHQPS